jgi:hypothetical protein
MAKYGRGEDWPQIARTTRSVAPTLRRGLGRPDKGYPQTTRITQIQVRCPPSAAGNWKLAATPRPVLDSACVPVYILGRATHMVNTKEKYVTDGQGNRIAVMLEVEEYRRLLDALEELESIRAYDTAVAVREDAIPFDKAVEELKRDRA